MIIEGLKIIGLCGRSGSGKGYVSRMFSLFGIPTVDTDAVYKGIISGGARTECVGELVSVFGSSIVDDEGNLIKRKLANIVFADGAADKLRMLNQITHKYILAETLRLLGEFRKMGKKAAIIDAPVLFESGFDYYCDIKICVTAPEEVLLERVCSRDGIAEFEAKMRLDKQLSVERLRQLCDGEIVNDGKTDIIEQIKKLIEQFELDK
ncbi:MAG: dephospho-CoA kinase [Clostridia bacterium]|nr:dephospho-CoA kinase [Clostridia bacterium]